VNSSRILHEQGLRKSSIARKLAALRSFFKYCVREGHLKENPARLVPTPKLPKRIPSVLSAEEMNGFLNDLGGMGQATPGGGAKPGRGAAALLPHSRATAPLADGNGSRLSEAIAPPGTCTTAWRRLPHPSEVVQETIHFLRESTDGMRFGSFGVGTSRAGFSFRCPSRTQYLKNERSAASFRAIELFFSPCSCSARRIHESGPCVTPVKSRRPDPRRRQKGDKLFEVFAVVQNRMRRGIPYRLQVLRYFASASFIRNDDSRERTRIQYRRAAIQRKAKSRRCFLRCRQVQDLTATGTGASFRLRLRLRFGRELLPIATFFEAGMHGADLGALFNNERRAALWARLGNRHERRGEIAIRITRAAIENTRRPAPLPALPRRTNSPSVHFGHLMPMVIGRVYCTSD